MIFHVIHTTFPTIFKDYTISILDTFRRNLQINCNLYISNISPITLNDSSITANQDNPLYSLYYLY